MPVVAPPPHRVSSGFTVAGQEHLLPAAEYCYIFLAILATSTALQLAIIYRLLRSWESRRASSQANNLQRSHTYEYAQNPPVYTAWTKPPEMESTLPKPIIHAAANSNEGLHASFTSATAGFLTGRSASLPALPTPSFFEMEHHGPVDASWQFSHHLPPPPPLTPPSLAMPAFPPGSGMTSNKMGASSELSFIHQPNPDYTVELSPLPQVSLSASPYANTLAATSPHRRNYTRLVPVRDPVLPVTVSTGSSEARTMTSEFWTSGDSQVTYASSQGHDTLVTSVEEETKREIGLRGEIISALDDAGAGWKRHTRVYGGGVCLACLAADNGGDSSPSVASKDAY